MDEKLNKLAADLAEQDGMSIEEAREMIDRSAREASDAKPKLNRRQRRKLDKEMKKYGLSKDSKPASNVYNNLKNREKVQLLTRIMEKVQQENDRTIMEENNSVESTD